MSSESVGDWSPTAAAHQQDVGVVLPALAPGLGLPVLPAPSNVDSLGAKRGGSGDDRGSVDDERDRRGSLEQDIAHKSLLEGSSGGGWGGRKGEAGAGAGAPRVVAMKALAGFPWPAPPSLCHPGSGVAARLVHAMGSLGEEEGHAALVSVLERCVGGAGGGVT